MWVFGRNAYDFEDLVNDLTANGEFNYDEMQLIMMNLLLCKEKKIGSSSRSSSRRGRSRSSSRSRRGRSSS